MQDPKTCCAMPSKNRAAFMTCAGEKKAANEVISLIDSKL